MALTAAAATGTLGHSGDRAVAALAAGTGPSLLTAEACRLRWAELDAEQWSEGQGQGHDAAPAPVQYKVPPPPMCTDAKAPR